MAKYEFTDNPLGDFGPLPDPTPVPPAEVPTDLFTCKLCGTPLPLGGIVAITHDCATGEVVPAE